MWFWGHKHFLYVSGTSFECILIFFPDLVIELISNLFSGSNFFENYWVQVICFELKLMLVKDPFFLLIIFRNLLQTSQIYLRGLLLDLFQQFILFLLHFLCSKIRRWLIILLSELAFQKFYNLKFVVRSRHRLFFLLFHCFLFLLMF